MDDPLSMQSKLKQTMGTTNERHTVVLCSIKCWSTPTSYVPPDVLVTRNNQIVEKIIISTFWEGHDKRFKMTLL